MSRDLDSGEAREIVGRTMAAIEEDCSKTWPDCPRRPQLICDCRHRALRAVSALMMHLAGGPQGEVPRG